MKMILVLILMLNRTQATDEGSTTKPPNDLGNLKSDLKSTLLDLKNKLKSNSQMKPKVELSPVGPRPGSFLDFPGRNSTRLAMIKEEWNAYYACLRLQEEVLGEDKIFNPESRLTIAGTNVKLDCNICVSPSDVGTEVKWFYWPTLTSNLSEITEIDNDVDVVMSAFDNSLHILNIQPKRGGMYLCKHSDSFIAPIYIEVVFKEPIVKVTMKNFTKHEARSVASSIDLNVFIKWQDWSPCSSCDKVGKKVRLGYCYLYRKNSDLFRLFEDGVPCRSQLLDDSLQEEIKIYNVPSELLVTLCKEKCSHNQIFQLTDEFGNILETANNSAGYYSLLQDVPRVPSSISMQTLIAEELSSVILICPGYSYDSEDGFSPVDWQTSNKLLLPRVLTDQSNGRVEIDSLGRMIFNQLWIIDSKIYSCWHNKQLVGLVKLQVIRNDQNLVQFGLGNHVFTFIALCLSMTFLYIAVRVFLTKNGEYR